MPRISSKITIGERVSLMSSVLLKEVILQYLQYRGSNWKNKRLYGKVIGGYEKPNDKELPPNIELPIVSTELFDDSDSSIEENDDDVNEENNNISQSSGPSTT
ncbi:1945_t:CDS:2, partial [Cetraspora pellucida]